MSLNHNEVGGIAERLAVDFDGLVQFEVIITVLQQCIRKDPTATSAQVEHAARMQLHLQRQATDGSR